MRTERYRQLLPVDRLTAAACTVIGVGAIGRQVGLQLATMGIGRAQLIDPDSVEEVNLGPQGYLQDDLGRPKVQATADLMRRLNHELLVEEVRGRFARSLEVMPVVFCCVDSIQTRRHIWSALRDKVDLFVDGRMAAEVLRVITVCDSVGSDRYPRTLFAEREALAQPCTARSTIYCANAAAGIMVCQFARWLRGMPVDFDVTLNLLALELTISDDAGR